MSKITRQRLAETAAARIPSRRAVSFVDDLTQTFYRSVGNPTFVLCVALSVLVIATHVDDPLAGPLGELMQRFSHARYIQWMILNIPKVFGLVVFVPVFLTTPKTSQSLIILSVVTGIVLLPAYRLAFYAFSAAAVHVYFHARLPSTRLLVLCAVAAIVTLYYVDIRHDSNQINLSSTVPIVQDDTRQAYPVPNV